MEQCQTVQSYDGLKNEILCDKKNILNVWISPVHPFVPIKDDSASDSFIHVLLFTLSEGWEGRN